MILVRESSSIKRSQRHREWCQEVVMQRMAPGVGEGVKEGAFLKEHAEESDGCRENVERKMERDGKNGHRWV